MFASSAVAAPAHSAPARSAHKTSSTTHGHAINCGQDLFSCTEVYDSDKFFGHYVGHDEPSILYYSHKPGSGNRMTYQLQLPTDPASSNPQNKSYNFQLQVAFWVGMAMCDTQSYPEQLSTCRRDSDRNIVDPTVSPNHPGTAFMEMQFYPPGWVPFQFATSCSATQWCAALTIDSLGADPVSGQLNNSACLSTVGEETVNFAFITKNGHPQAPPNPVDSTLATFTPDPQRDLFMASGDKIGIKLHDTAHGLRVDLLDRTTGQRGHMVSSAANGFGQVKFDPNGTTCQNIPYDFHPMYSTSTPQTQVPWAAHTYNVAFDDEIGHFDHCTHVDSTTNTCAGMEGRRGHQEANDGDDFGCFSSAMSFLVKINGCLGTNTGFDGDSYLPLWPNGNLRQRPSPILISSPLTGRHYSTNYQKAGLEAD
ncbi:MAG: hypothetical protein ACRDP1_01830, partial [Nocardioidaceae bacterium]